ncbi:hypothetical protein S40288_07853 [Stachybotrys chartarum IBT 40288]|nr:hypothetical protein S40288_07853 [Stachybotrys chartarum IBT 40288]
MIKVHSSRRATGLKPGDYDHEIDLVDRDGSASLRNDSIEPSDISRTDTASRLIPPCSQNGESSPPTPRPNSAADPRPNGNNEDTQNRSGQGSRQSNNVPQSALWSSIEVSAPDTGTFHDEDPSIKPERPRIQRETAIDILYENERGGFLCGNALFSSKALGSLDPPAWTNAYHKPSPTSIFTAQVPDPSWEWAWSDWTVNHQEGMDEHGWEYSFAFSKKFSWHGPKWWNSFVRRRAWIRKRIRKLPEDISADPHMANSDYFVVRSAMDPMRGSQGTLPDGRVPSKGSLTQVSIQETAEKPDIEDVGTLLRILSLSRIDREKLDAVENYLLHAKDLGQLQMVMHDIMSIFVFQASRRHLLTRLTHIYDETTRELEGSDDADLRDRQKALQAAIKHADEETRRLAYWSDIKQMTESGEAVGAVDSEKGWDDDRWQGVDNSGPAEPNSGKLPGS